MEVSEAFEPLNVDRRRLLKIGWTKLQKVAKYVDEDNVEELISHAESMNAKQLEGLMNGKEVQRYVHCVNLYLSAPQYEKYVTAFLKHGAVQTKGGHGLQKKATALMNIIDKVL